jgi:alcohol dehydrogenase (cytochrome c)
MTWWHDPLTGRFDLFVCTVPLSRPCCGRINRGVAIAGDTLFMGTIDAHLVAIAKNGKPLWNTTVAKAESGYALTHAPLIVKDKVIVGVAGGEFGIRGFIAAYDVKTGKEAWRFYTIPGAGEPGNQTWSGDSWKHGGASVWVTGSFDPDLNLTYWGIGNAGPDYDGDVRKGDNLYSSSVVALDGDTGKIKWHYQFSPHDEFDWDATQVPVLADIAAQGRLRKVMLWPTRNGFFTLDRPAESLLGKPFVEVNWASGFDETAARCASQVNCSAGGNRDLPGQSGRHELVFAVVQSADGAVLYSVLGELFVDLFEWQAGVHRRESLSRCLAALRYRRHVAARVNTRKKTKATAPYAPSTP